MIQYFEDHKKLRGSENIELTLGENCQFEGMVIQNDGARKISSKSKVKIGKHFTCGTGCLIRTSDHNAAKGYPMAGGGFSKFVARNVTIGEYVWFGDGVVVMKGVTIGDGAIIQHDSVVVSNIPPLAIACGHPCRVYAMRDEKDFRFFKSLNLAEDIPEGAADLEEKRKLFDLQLKKFRADRKARARKKIKARKKKKKARRLEKEQGKNLAEASAEKLAGSETSPAGPSPEKPAQGELF